MREKDDVFFSTHWEDSRGGRHSKIDLADIDQGSASEPGGSDSVFLHEIVESYYYQTAESGHHEKACKAESDMTGWDRPLRFSGVPNLKAEGVYTNRANPTQTKTRTFRNIGAR